MNTTGRILIAILILFISNSFLSSAQLPKETESEKNKRMEWWTHDRFGLFIHFGLYALPARHEWVKSRENLTNEQYQKYFDNFDPDMYNPKEWAQAAKKAGMKYAVITTKHHEGFCLFDSKYTDYKSTKTPYGKDIIREFVDAFRAEGIKIGFYYSLLDWHHPDYTIDSKHPQHPQSESDSAYIRLNQNRDMSKYREYMKNQVRELLTNYGDISIIWFDFSFPPPHGKNHDDWDSEGLLKMVRKLQPGIIVDDRLDLQDVDGGFDFVSPEQFMVSKNPEINGKKVSWETCQTFSGSWGYYRDETSWKSNTQLIAMLIESVSKGGNLILNVGPTARGCFDYRAQERLTAIGEWMKYNSRSIYGCTEAPSGFIAPPNSLLTYNPKTNRLYIHFLSYPTNSVLLKNIADKVKYIQILQDGSEVSYSIKKEDNETDLKLKLPILKPNEDIVVLEVMLK